MIATKPGGIVPVRAGLLAGLHQGVGYVQKLHDSLVQVQVLQTLEQIGVLASVASIHPSYPNPAPPINRDNQWRGFPIPATSITGAAV